MAHVLGLLFLYFKVAITFWTAALAMLPQCRELLLQYSSSFACLHGVLLNAAALVYAFSGITAASSFYECVLLLDIEWLVCGAELRPLLPVQILSVVSYTAAHIVISPVPSASAWSACGAFLAYLLLGLGVPLVMKRLLEDNGRLMKASEQLLMVVSLAGVSFHLLDRSLHTRKLAESLQQLPDAGGNSPLRLLLRAALSAPEGDAPYGYGIKQSFSVALLLALLLVYGMSVLFVELLDALPKGGGLLWQTVSQNPLLLPLYNGVLALADGKKIAVGALLSIAGLQLLGFFAAAAQLVLHGLPAFLDTVPLLLLAIGMGVLGQVMSILFIILPSKEAADTGFQNGSAEKLHATASSLPGSLPGSFSVANMGISSSVQHHSTSVQNRRQPGGMHSPTGAVQPSSPGNGAAGFGPEFVGMERDPRVAAVINLRGALQALGMAGASLDPDSFARMAANAVKGAFPAVYHASMSIINSGTRTVDMFTVVGVGSRQPPQLGMAVAPGTLLLYVLDGCQPVFIPSTFHNASPFSDVQFMAMALKLQSVAALPLLWEGVEIVGALQLGFTAANSWLDHDKNLAKQLAMSLALGCVHMRGSNPQGMGAAFRGAAPQHPGFMQYAEQAEDGYRRMATWAAKPNSGGMNSGGGGRMPRANSDTTLGPGPWGEAGPPGNPSSANRVLSRTSTGLSSSNQPGLLDTGAPGTPSRQQTRLALDSPAAAQPPPANDLADLQMMQVIGRGGFGSVYKGIWRGETVAVKVLEHDDFLGCGEGSSGGRRESDSTGARAALLEGAMTSAINHPHVVHTLHYQTIDVAGGTGGSGVPQRGMQQTHIIMEFCDQGCLQDVVQKGAFLKQGGGTEPSMDWEALLMTLAEVAGALEYLHTNRITHRDLKPKNILLKSINKDRRGFTAKVSDFGLSQVLAETEDTHISTKYSGTITHMPPELIEDGRVYPEGDVYAFGIIMWEILTGGSPYANMARPQIMVGVVTHNLRPKFPERVPEWYRQLAYKCWQKDPKQRPPFSEILQELLMMVQTQPWVEGGQTVR